jgi:hypothetical protein
MQPMTIGQAPAATSGFSAASHAYARVRGLYSETSTKQRRVFGGSLLALGIVALIIILAVTLTPKPGIGDNGRDDDTDPLTFETELEQAISQAPEEADASPEEDTTGQMPAGCKSREKDSPGEKNGARIQFVHIPNAGGSSVVRLLAYLVWIGLYN